MLRDTSISHVLLLAAAQALLQDCASYFSTTGRRVTFEYTLMSGTNDDPEQVHTRIGMLWYMLYVELNGSAALLRYQ